MGRFFKILAITLVALLAGTGAVGIATTILPEFRERVELILNLKDENSIKFLKDKIKGYQSQVDSLNAQIKDLQERVKELQESDADLNAKIVELKARVKTLESQVASLEKTISDLNLQVDTLTEQVDSMWNIFDNYQLNDDYTSGATSEKPKLTAKEKTMVDDQVKKLESKIEDLTNQVKDLNNTINDLNSQIEDLKKDKSDAEEKKNMNDTIIIEKKTEITNIETTINDYRTQIENNNQKYEDNRTQIENNNVTINELEKKENKTEEEQNQLNSLKETNSELETENTKIEEQRDLLQEQLTECENKVKELNSQVTILEDNNKTYTKQIAELDTQISAMENQVSEIQTSASTIQSNIDKAQAKANKFKDLVANSIIVNPSNPDTPNPTPEEPDTPSEDEDIKEFGTRYYKDFDLSSFKNLEVLGNLFNENSGFLFQNVTDKDQISNALNNKIPSAYYMAQGLKLDEYNAFQNNERDTFTYFFILMYKAEDRQKAEDYINDNFTDGNMSYYYISNEMAYIETISKKSEPDTPSEDFELEYGKRYFTELADFTTSEELENYFKENKDYKFSSLSGDKLVVSGLTNIIPSVFYMCDGYKLVDYNSSNETYISFSYMLFEAKDKQTEIDFLKNNLTDEMLKQINYYLISDNFIYVEYIQTGSKFSTDYTEGKSLVSYDRKDGLFIRDNETNEITQIYSRGRHWFINNGWLSSNKIVFASSESNGIIVIDSANDSVKVLTDNDTWNNFDGTVENVIYIRNADNTKQIAYNLETGEFKISDYKEPTEQTSKIIIDGQGYEFVVGSTFLDWLSSKYNIDKLVSVNNQIENFEKTKVLTIDDRVVNVGDAIIDGAEYVLKDKQVEETTETTYTGGATKSNPDLGALSIKDSAIKYLNEKINEEGTNEFTNIQSSTSGYNLQGTTDCLVMANTDWGGYISIVYYSETNMQNVLDYIQKEMESKDNCTVLYYYVTSTYAVVESVLK